MRLNKLVLSGIAVLSAINLAHATEEDNKIYVAPTDVLCQMQDGKIFCTDKENKPVTGQIITFKNRVVIYRYDVKNGYMDGLSKSYYPNGKLKNSLNYTNGVINGIMVEYNEETGAISSLTTYKNGIKEGRASISTENSIFNMTYANDMLDGPMNIITNPPANLCAELKKHFPDYECETRNLYQLTFKQDKLMNGTYGYIAFSECGNQKDCARKIIYNNVDIPHTIITGINNKCLKLKENLSVSECAVIADGKNTQCDKTWLKTVQEEVKEYLRKCRCPKLYNGSYQKGSNEYENYKNHCMVQE